VCLKNGSSEERGELSNEGGGGEGKFEYKHQELLGISISIDDRGLSPTRTTMGFEGHKKL